jgi:hypothetical protein
MASIILPRRQTSKKKLSRAQQIELIRSIKGKYAHVKTSSEDYAKEKKEEIDHEDRRFQQSTR